MGKQGRQTWSGDAQHPWQQAQQGSQSSSWSYWGGPWKAKADKDKADSNKANKFPVYSQTPLPKGSVATEGDSTDFTMEVGSMGTYMRDLQKALSACRRAEGKMRKLQDLRIKREQQWQQYQKDLKASYLTQKKQFQRDMEVLNQDLTQAVSVSRAAIAEVQAFAQGQEGSVSSPLHQAASPAVQQEAEEAWDFLMQADAEMASPVPAQSDTMLAQALQEAHELAKTTRAMQDMQLRPLVSPLRKTVVTPKRGTTSGIPRPMHQAATVPSQLAAQAASVAAPLPPTQDMLRRLQLNLQQLQTLPPTAEAASVPAMDDPYQTPPPVPNAPTSPVTPAVRTPPHRSPGHKARTGIKESSKHAATSRPPTARVPLSDLLQEKRDRMTAALETGQSLDGASHSQSFLIDDDPEGDATSPGFGLME